MVFAWARRARELHDELAAITDVSALGPTWWAVAGTAAAAEPLPPRAHYVVSDAEPNGDTFIGHRCPSPSDPIVDAITRAHAARAALRELDGKLPDQPLAVTIQRSDMGARVVASSLEVAAFAIGDAVVIARLAEHIDGERALVAKLVAIARTSTTTFGDDARIRFDDSLARRVDDSLARRVDDSVARDGSFGASDARPDAAHDAVPFVCVSIGEERITVARHGHRRAWRNGAGPWLGLGRVGELATTSTCHMVVDGYGHAWLAASIAEHAALLARSLARSIASSDPTASNTSSTASNTSSNPTASNTSSNPTASNPTASDPSASAPNSSNATSSNTSSSNPTSNPTSEDPSSSNPTASKPNASDPNSSNPTEDMPLVFEQSSNNVRTSGSSEQGELPDVRTSGTSEQGELPDVRTSFEQRSDIDRTLSSGLSADELPDVRTSLEQRSNIDRTLSSDLSADDIPHLALVPDAIPLGVAWRELPSPAPRALELAYALGRVLHRVAGKPDAKFSPTFQIPIAPGAPDDLGRSKRRVVPTAISVRFDDGNAEPFEVFEKRAREILAREAQGRGLCSRLLTAARAVPVPLAFKRRSFTAGRAGVFDKIAEVVGGRACLSKIRMSTPVPLSCAVSSPARLATKADPVGGCVLTIVEDGERAAITACGSGLAGSADDAADLIDAVFALLAPRKP